MKIQGNKRFQLKSSLRQFKHNSQSRGVEVVKEGKALVDSVDNVDCTKTQVVEESKKAESIEKGILIFRFYIEDRNF